MSFEGITADGARTYYSDVVNDFANEIKLMEMLKGAPNVVSVENYKIVERENEIGRDIYIRMEYLQSFVSYSKNKRFSEADVKKFALDIANALDVCSKNATNKKNNNKKKIILFSILGVVAALVLVYGAIVAFNYSETGKINYLPWKNLSVSQAVNGDKYHYSTAMGLIETGNYAEAYSHLVQCIDYKDSGKLLNNFVFENFEINSLKTRYVSYDENGNITYEATRNFTNVNYFYENGFEYD